MISIELVLTLVSGLQRPDLERWIVHRLVLPDSAASGYVFREIDVARVRLIRELRDNLQVNEEALPIVLSLLDQLYEVRRRMRELGQALGRTAPLEVRQAVVTQLTGDIESNR
jgi:chaperone modulatory protein CbpM